MSRGDDAPAPPSLAERLSAFRYRSDEDVSGLLLPEGGGAPTAPAPASQALREYLSFELQEATYAVALSEVQEILRARPLVEIPRALAPLLGVLDVRGTVTPVYDLGFALGLRTKLRRVAGPWEDSEEVPREARILVARTPAGPAGMWVDRVRDVVRLAPASIEGVPEGGPLSGRALSGEKLLLLLELERVLS